MAGRIKPVRFLGSSLRGLRSFSTAARREAGYQLEKVQIGKEPNDRKSMPTVGSGGIELRICDEAGAPRVMQVAKFEAAIHVLHCFQKKTQATSKGDVEIAASRYRELVRELEK